MNTDSATTEAVWTAVFCFFLLAHWGVKVWLASRQIRHVAAHQETVPAAFAHTIDLAAHQKAAQYTIAKTRLGLLSTSSSTAILLGWTLLGGLHALNHALVQLMGHGLWQQLALLGGFVLIGALLELPLSWYATFRVEERFGFNKMTLGLWVTDGIKGALVGAVLGLPIAALVLWLMEAAGPAWWLWAWLAWTGFNLLLLLVYPTWIAPLFNQFKPLDDESLKTRVQALMQRCGFQARGLFVMDGSKRSAHGNAFFAGMGKAKRIVFFDTLIEKLNPGEVEAVLAHELGHYKCNHIRKRLLVSFILSFGMFALLGWISTKVWFYTDLGVMPNLNGYNGGLALALFMLVSPVFSFFFTPLSSLASRKHEYEADGFAAEKSSAKDLISALVKLYQDNASTLTPDPLYTAFYSSHPPAPLRIANLQRFQ